jgi:UDP-glucose 4-epimerase
MGGSPRLPPSTRRPILHGMNVLVVGGAGYIGSHCVRRLLAAGHRAVVLDDLSLGHASAVPDGTPLVRAGMDDASAVRETARLHGIEAVFHFAALANVGESVREPERYHAHNVVKTHALLAALEAAGVRKFVFSSTCAVYGVPPRVPISEDMPRVPVNPYGRTKLEVELSLEDAARAGRLAFAALRYFNAAGAAADGSTGEDHEPETHLIPLAIGAALGRRPPLTVFGTDYPTPDGTCLRDYVHVDDLADAHVAALARLDRPGVGLALNLGTGRPHSVREVIASVERVGGRPVPHAFGPRREGDPPALFADATRARAELGWAPRHVGLDDIVSSAWRWHISRPR